MEAEVEYAIRKAKPKKAVELNEISSEIFKMLNEENIRNLTILFNAIYDTRELSKEWLKLMFITLPKELSVSKCDEYRMISLMTHLLKIFIRIIYSRIRTKYEEDLDDTQFGFG